METTTGRRERKKAATRQALSDAAWRLFSERGFDQVTVAQVAEEADTSIATVFKHFPDGKAALIFGEEHERRTAFQSALDQRAAGTGVLTAARDFLGTRGASKPDPTPEFQRRLDLIMATPVLREYARRMWICCEDLLAEALAAEAGTDAAGTDAAVGVRALARFALEAPSLAGLEPHPRQALDAIFQLLETGWARTAAQR
ncbi:TetR/AcrR family transcriptional regulator [Streptacidiphilus sp. N1-3]|uniref:TetR/AcrR family transcriptional regulator n=1 Tax=Streptacidiphilus alkalitolerans TaxID=3342712 RepID=A0ABV6X2Y5_9ACTN